MLRSFSMSISLTALNIFAHWECACMRVLVCEVSIECVMLYASCFMPHASCHIPYALVCDRVSNATTETSCVLSLSTLLRCMCVGKLSAPSVCSVGAFQ